MNAMSGSPRTRSKAKLSTSSSKQTWMNKKGERTSKDKESPEVDGIGDGSDSLLDVNTVHSTQFLETLNLKSKAKTTGGRTPIFHSDVFISDDSSPSQSLLCKVEENENGDDDSAADTILEIPTKSLRQSESLDASDGHNSLGKTLAFSLQLIAAGSESVSPQIPSPHASPLGSLSPKDMKSELLENEEETTGLKEIGTPPRSRYLTRSSSSQSDHPRDSDSPEHCHLALNDSKAAGNQEVNREDPESAIVIDCQESATPKNSPDPRKADDHDGAEEKDVVVFLPKPKKRGRRRKEEISSPVPKGNVFVCSQCGKSFNKSQTLRQHFITHTDRFACTFCNVRCKSKGDLKSHTQTHTKEKPYRCEVCNTFYTRESILKKHKLTQLHQNACFQLGNQIQRALNADMSVTDRRKRKIGKFFCHQCPKTLISKHKLRQHLKMHEYTFSCPHCNKRCKNEIQLKYHQKCHLQVNSLPCKFCSRVFNSHPLLKQHIRSAHSFIYWRRRFPGNIWKSLLAQKVECIADLKAELRSIKSGGQFVCNVCSRIFKSKKAFEKHCAKHNNETLTSGMDKLSERSAPRKIPKYHCSECAKSFTYFDEFIKHHKELHNDKLLTCHICYSQFDQPAEFKSHVQNHGPTMLFSGASLEETKIPHVHKRNRRSHFQESGSGVIDVNNTSKENEIHAGEDDDAKFLESHEFLQFLSTAFDDDSDEDKDGGDSCDDDEDLYTGVKMLLCDSDDDCIITEKTSKVKLSNTAVKKKPDLDMKLFCIQDDENNFYKCSPCNTLFITSDQLKDHMDGHLCIHCNVFCQNKDELDQHFHCQEKESRLTLPKDVPDKPTFDDLSDLQSDDDATFTSEDEMNEIFLDELEGILDCENKAAPSVDFLNTFSHDEIIKTNKKIFERYSCIDVPTNIYACIICKRKYARPTTLTRHFKTHVCHYCNTFFVDKSDLNDHKYKHKKKAAMIKAEISGESNSKILRSPLVSKVNRELFKKFTIVDSSRNINKCCLCDKLFVRKTVLTRHMKTHVCSYCDKFFEDKYELARHVSMHKMDPHIPEEDSMHRQYPVFDSEKPFDPTTAFSNQLEEDSKMVAIGSSYSTSLPQFTTTFSTPSTNANETVTFIQIPVSEACTDPNAVTFGPGVTADAPTYQILSDPIVQSQGSYIVAPQNCHGDDANKMITLTQDHLLAGNRCPVETPDLFECNVCSKTFFKSGHLKSHISTHSAPAPYACRYCGKTFVRNGPLRKHEKTHDVKRCDHCDMSFTCQFELDHHMQIHETYPFYK